MMWRRVRKVAPTDVDPHNGHTRLDDAADKCVHTFLLVSVLLLCIGAVIHQAEMLEDLKQRTTILESSERVERRADGRSLWLIFKLFKQQDKRTAALESLSHENIFEQEDQNKRTAKLEHDKRNFDDSLVLRRWNAPNRPNDDRSQTTEQDGHVQKNQPGFARTEQIDWPNVIAD